MRYVKQKQGSNILHLGSQTLTGPSNACNVPSENSGTIDGNPPYPSGPYDDEVLGTGTIEGNQISSPESYFPQFKSRIVKIIASKS